MRRSVTAPAAAEEEVIPEVHLVSRSRNDDVLKLLEKATESMIDLPLRAIHGPLKLVRALHGNIARVVRYQRWLTRGFHLLHIEWSLKDALEVRSE